MKWLSALDKLLYEVVCWLLFYPLTLYRSIRRPLAMTAYSDAQLTLPDETQYIDALNPPLFLALSLLLAHGISAAFGQSDAIVESRHGLASLINDNMSALAFRVVMFASFPVLMAARLTRRRGMRLDRLTLRAPFYAQCYPTAVFMLSLSIGGDLGRLEDTSFHLAGGIVIAAGILFYLAVETRWFARTLATGLWSGFGAALLGMVEGLGLLLGVGLLFTL